MCNLLHAILLQLLQECYNNCTIILDIVTCAICCMQRTAIVACNNCRLSNVFENIHEAKVLQPMTAFGGIT